MKRLFILLLCIFLMESIHAQITVIKPNEVKEEVKKAIEPYDSVKSIQQVSPFSLIGQTFYFHPSTYGKEKGYYVAAIYSKIPENYNRNIHVYKPVQKGESSWPAYDAVAEHYFKVIDCIQVKSAWGKPRYWLQLVEKESNDTVYFDKEVFDSHSCTVIGYFEKKKSQNIGKRFITKRDSKEVFDIFGSLNNYKGLQNIENAEPLTDVPQGTIFTCSDVSFYYDKWGNHIALKLQNDKFGTCFIIEKDKDTLLESYEVFLEQQRQDANYKRRMIAKYGQTKGALIAAGKVRIGFTKDMCKEAWGNPQSINRTIVAGKTHEQWVYDDGSYLYFDNGRLTAIQD